MAISWIFNDAGRIALDDVTRLATVYNASGAQVGAPRPFTTAEAALVDSANANAAANANRASIETALAAELDEIQTEFLTPTNAALNSAFAANNARYLKILARIMRRIIRLLIRRFDGTA